MRSRVRSIALLAALATLLAALPSTAAEPALRPLTPDDLFTLEELGQVALSPDGQWLAYSIRRPKASALMHGRPFLEGNDRADLWVVPAGGGTPRRITDGAPDGSGWWAPSWSPDSRRLGALSTRGGNVRLWMWDRPAARWTRLTERGVDLIPGSEEGAFVWLDERRVVCPLLPAGERPNLMTVEMRAAERSMREWPKAWGGEEPTAIVLESGAAPRIEERAQVELALIDVERGSRTIASGLSFRNLRVSSDRRHVAALRQVDVIRPEPDRAVAQGGNAIFEAVAFGGDGERVLTELAGVKRVAAGSLQWSPDGTKLALVGRLGTSEPRAVVCARSAGTCAPFQPDAAAVLWPAKGALFFLARGEGGRQDWWTIDARGRARNLTSSMKTVPRTLIREAGRSSLVGLADGEIWRIRPDGEPQTLTAQLDPAIIGIVWPRSGEEGEQAIAALIVSVRTGETTAWHSVDLASGASTALGKPAPEARLLTFDPQRKIAVLSASDRSGTYLWLARVPFANVTTVVETNTHLRAIEQTSFRRIEYKNTEGRQLNAWALLPYGYRENERYPLIAVVYGGNVFGERAPSGGLGTINSASSLNYHLLAAHGYAVLFPSIPLQPEGVASDPYSDVAKSVLPAVDAAIESGLADPDRLGVLGHSYGGYTTYALIAQTDRFRAAVSMAGLSELIALYGGLDPRFRFDPNAHERLSNLAQAESGQLRMGSAPWIDAERYIRNSPFFHADRIATPLLIVQGDMDYIPIQQGEQMFTALYRQNKRASLLRYLGEGHVIGSPANTRDLWMRIYAWLDEFVGMPEAETLAE